MNGLSADEKLTMHSDEFQFARYSADWIQEREVRDPVVSVALTKALSDNPQKDTWTTLAGLA